MLNDLEIITKKFPGNDDITIIPISDVHLGAKEHKQTITLCGDHKEILVTM